MATEHFQAKVVQSLLLISWGGHCDKLHGIHQSVRYASQTLRLLHPKLGSARADRVKDLTQDMQELPNKFTDFRAETSHAERAATCTGVTLQFSILDLI